MCFNLLILCELSLSAMSMRFEGLFIRRAVRIAEETCLKRFITRIKATACYLNHQTKECLDNVRIHRDSRRLVEK